MAKILTGIQSTGTPHLGNILGAIIPAIKMANESNEESYLFIANMHSLTQIKNKDVVCHGKNKDRYGRIIAVCFSEKLNLN